MIKWRRTLIVLLTCCLLLPACTTTNSSDPIMATSPNEDAMQDGQVLTIVSPQTSNEKSSAAESSEKYQIQTKITEFQLLDESTGIAWGLTRGELRLYMTMNKGQTWANISPAAAVQFPSSLHYGKDILFLDAKHGWIIRKSMGNMEGVLLHTEDGGLNWKITSLPMDSAVDSMYFLTTTLGWLVSTESESPGNQTKLLYRTDDGGKTWASFGPQSSQLATGKDGDQKGLLPSTGYFSGMAFSNSQQGVVVLQDSNSSSLYLSSDAGQHWQEDKAIFNKIKQLQYDRYTAGTPQFFQPSGLNGYIPVMCSKDMSNKFNGFFTSNGGQSFQFVQFSLDWQSEANAAVAPVFLNDKEGWSLQGTSLYHTEDQGKTWNKLPDNEKLSTTLETHPEVIKLQFITSKQGWILVQNSEQHTSRLLQTDDGGLTWRML